MKACTYGGLKTPDNESKLEVVDTRVRQARGQAAAAAKP